MKVWEGVEGSSGSLGVFRARVGGFRGPDSSGSRGFGSQMDCRVFGSADVSGRVR